MKGHSIRDIGPNPKGNLLVCKISFVYCHYSCDIFWLKYTCNTNFWFRQWLGAVNQYHAVHSTTMVHSLHTQYDSFHFSYHRCDSFFKHNTLSLLFSLYILCIIHLIHVYGGLQDQNDG